uniref:Uncharacterized protein n=1 Tax=Hucho hucho TaxID=62062 RepID=A0A4W5LBW5_9TELE
NEQAPSNRGTGRCKNDSPFVRFGELLLATASAIVTFVQRVIRAAYQTSVSLPDCFRTADNIWVCSYTQGDRLELHCGQKCTNLKTSPKRSKRKDTLLRSQQRAFLLTEYSSSQPIMIPPASPRIINTRSRRQVETNRGATALLLDSIKTPIRTEPFQDVYNVIPGKELGR